MNTKHVLAGTIAGLALMGAVAAGAASVDVIVRSARQVVATAPGFGVDQVCISTCDAPDQSVGCAITDPTVDGQEVTFDVTALMVPGVPSCFRAFSVSPEGIQSVASENAARGTVPQAPTLR
jgi:hypothetical protein